MKANRIYALTGAALLAVVATTTVAQTNSPDVRTESSMTRSGSLAPAGQGPGAMGTEMQRSTRTRAERKSETLMERRMGGLTPAGQGGVKPDHMHPTSPRVKSRASVMAKTRAAERAGTLQPAGETPQPVAQPAPK